MSQPSRPEREAADPVNAPHDPGSRMAQLQVGDWWEYDGRGSVERERPVELRGKIRVAIEEWFAGGRMRSAVVFSPAWRITGVEGAEGVFPMPHGVFYVEQDPVTRDVAISGDNMGPNGTDRFAAVPQVFYPGRFEAGTAYANVLDFGPLGTVANTLRTVAVESVETGLGRLAAWKSPISSVSDLFGRVEGCDWWRPGLGAPLRFEMSATGPDGSRLSTQAVLRATNRVLG